MAQSAKAETMSGNYLRRADVAKCEELKILLFELRQETTTATMTK